MKETKNLKIVFLKDQLSKEFKIHQINNKNIKINDFNEFLLYINKLEISKFYLIRI